MITASDILRLEFTPDLAHGGILYACHSLPRLHTGTGVAGCHRLRQRAAQAAAELALRRHLVTEHVPFDVRPAIPFTDPSRFDISLHGHRCDLKTYLITNPKRILSIEMDPGQLLAASALVPSDQHAAEGQSGDDLYLFAFLLGGNSAAPSDRTKPRAAKQPQHLVHLMPVGWSHPRSWIPLGPLVLKSDDPGMLKLEIGGQDREREDLACPVALPPRTRLELAEDFHSVTYLHVETRPAGRLGIRSPSRGETQVIHPMEWRDIWIDGRALYLAGWITREQFGQRARQMREGSRVFPHDRTQTKHLTVRVSDLKPLAQLLVPARS